jgi:hypothetical protein
LAKIISLGSKDHCEKILNEKLVALDEEEASVDDKSDETTVIKHTKKSKKRSSRLEK